MEIVNNISVYHVSADSNRYAGFHRRREIELPHDVYLKLYAGASFLPYWTTPSVDISPGILGDFARGPITLASISATQRAVDCLGSLWADCVELLPITHGKAKFWAVFVPHTSDCLDVDASEFWGERGDSAIRSAVFIPDKIPDSLLFRLPGQYEYYCTSRFKALIEQHKLTGLSFARIWADGQSVQEEFVGVNVDLSKSAKRVPKKGRPSKRDKLLLRLWSDVIDSAAGVDHLDRFLQMPPPPDNSVDLIADASRVLQVAVAKGVEENALRQMIRSLAYHIVFDTLIALEEEGADTTPALRSLHEDLLMAQRQ